jgi:hypothetical protein
MNPEQYAGGLLTDAYDEIQTAVYDVKLLRDLADAMQYMRGGMASGDCFFVRIECIRLLRFGASYYLEREQVGEVGADGGQVVEIVPFDPVSPTESQVALLRRMRDRKVDASSAAIS